MEMDMGMDAGHAHTNEIKFWTKWHVQNQSREAKSEFRMRNTAEFHETSLFGILWNSVELNANSGRSLVVWKKKILAAFCSDGIQERCFELKKIIIGQFLF